ncbi:MAG: hypothetical protein JKY52_00175 [Flavobacteriales bacterium]|nr:hypothetical protein [Flavobacteriales bacterium]
MRRDVILETIMTVYQFVGGELASSSDTEILVQKASDLAGTLRSDVAYLIDGSIDMGSQSIIVPQGGLTLMGNGFNIAQLTTSVTNATLFVDDGVFAGDLFLRMMDIEVTGTGAKVFDLDNNENSDAIEFDAVNFNNCTSLGSMDSYRQLLARNVAFFAPADGLEFIGPWSGGLAIVDTIVILLPSGATLFKAGTGFLVGASVRSDMNALSVDASSTIFDFAPSNITPDGGFSLSNFRTAADDALPNFPSSSVKANFSNCIGISNTFPGGNWSISSAATTTIGMVDTLVKLAGTTTYNGLQWFTGSNNNEFVFESTQEIDIVVSGILTFTGGANDEMAVQIRRFDDSASSYVNVGSEFSTTISSGGRASNLPFRGVTTVAENDRIEVWVKNLTDDTDITGSVGGSVAIGERSSV